MRERYGSWALRMLAVMMLLITFSTAKGQGLINPVYYPTISVKNYSFYPNGSLLVPAPAAGGERYFYVPVFIYNETQYRTLNYNVRDSIFIRDSLYNANIGGQRLEPIRSFEFQMTYFTQAMALDTQASHGSPISMVGPGKSSDVDTALARKFYVRYSDVSDPGPLNNPYQHRIRIAAASEVPLPFSKTQDTSGVLLWLRFKVIPSPITSGLIGLDSARWNDHYGDSLVNPLTYKRGNFGGDNANGQGNVVITPQPSFDFRPFSLITTADNKNFDLTTDLVYDPTISGATAPSLGIQVRDGQSGSRLTNINVTTDQPWLQVSTPNPAGGNHTIFIRQIDYTSSTGSGEVPVWITALPGGLQPGIYYGTVTFTSDGASNSPSRIRVKFVVRRNPDEPTPGGTGIHLTLTNSCNQPCSTTLVFGTGPGASAAIDPLYGETIFDANSKVQHDTNLVQGQRCYAYFAPVDTTADRAFSQPGFLGTLRDIRSNQTDTTLLYKVVFSAGDPLCYPVTVCVDPADFPQGGRIIARDILNGSIFSVDLRQGTEVGSNRCFVIRDPKITAFYIEYTPGTIGTVPTLVKNGWNLVSLPVLPPNNSASVIFPNAAGTPFAYRASIGWVPTTTLEFGRGYMIKYGNFIPPTEPLIAGVRMRQISNVRVDAGWNTIGALSIPVNVCNISFSGLTPTAPTPLQQSEVYEYVTGRGYQQVAYLTPGVGYFVKVSDEGYYNLSSTACKVGATAADELTGTLSEVDVRDAAQNGQALYFGNANATVNEKQFELPPTIHELDARFVTNSGFISYNKQNYTVSIKTNSYPVAMSFSKLQGDVEVRDVMGNLIGTASNGGTVVINDSKVQQVVISAKSGSAVASNGYALEQNYPNPFNPTTSIFYSIPVDGKVTIVVTNQLGQVVKTVFDGYTTAGRHEVKFDGADLASGTYFYTMKSGSFTQTAKMSLNK